MSATRVVETRTERRPAPVWSPGQIVAGVVGGGLTVVGAAALLRAAATGMTSLTEPAVQIGWLAATPLFALLLLIVGAVTLSIASVPTIRRAGATGVGATMVLFSVVGLIETSVMQATLGVTVDGLVTYLLAGLVLMAASWWSPLLVRRRSRQ